MYELIYAATKHTPSTYERVMKLPCPSRRAVAQATSLWSGERLYWTGHSWKRLDQMTEAQRERMGLWA